MKPYTAPLPEELVADLAPGLRIEDLTIEEVSAIDHAINNHVQTVWVQEDNLRMTVLAILKERLKTVNFRGTVYTVQDGRLIILR